MAIIRCKCSHAYQDSVYGKGMRVHNPTMKEGKYRCTVCGAVNTMPKIYYNISILSKNEES